MPLWPANGPHLAALPSATKEPIAAVGFEPRHTHASRHLELLQNLPRLRVDAPQITLVAFPGAVPELSVDPRHPGDEAVGLDGAENLARVRIDLMNLPRAILAHPKRSLCPREPRVAAAAGRWNRRQHLARLGIDLPDAIFSDLKEMSAVEGRSSVRGDVDRSQRLAARGIERVQLVACGEPDVLTVVRHVSHVGDTGEWAVLAENFGGCFSHASILVDWQSRRE